MSHHHNGWRKYSTLLIGMLVLVIALSAFAAPAVAASQPLGHLHIPALELEAPIVHVPLAYPSWDLTRLGALVGYLEGTAGVDNAGNTVLAGHSTTPSLAPSVFANLHLLQPGDEIIVTVNGGEKRYVVDSVAVVDETDLSAVMPTAHDQLTLLTCAVPSYQAANGTYSQRYIVRALPA